MMGKIEEAGELHARGANCAQSVLCPFAHELGLEPLKALALATGFGGGMGRMAGTCGAVTGAFMVLGLARGMSRPEDKAAKDAGYALVREMARRFTEKNGSILCRELLECDISTEEGAAEAREKNLFATRCNPYIEDSVRILTAILADTLAGD
jgi:C_GCAxxG_C_C family probable redox protein